jgi:hypothetical protein
MRGNVHLWQLTVVGRRLHLHLVGTNLWLLPRLQLTLSFHPTNITIRRREGKVEEGEEIGVEAKEQTNQCKRRFHACTTVCDV